MAVLVGSAAMKHHFVDSREPADIDLFSRTPVPGADVFWDSRLAEWWEDSDHIRPATVSELYTIKVSHLFWNRKWDRHATDAMLLKRAGATFIPALYDILYPIWVDKYGAKKAALKGSKDEFFDDLINRVYDHDSVHESVAYYDRPLYEKILIPGSVAVDMNLWDDLSHEDKLRMVREEVYATALERKVIPAGYKGSARAAYAWSLMHTITSLTKGKFALFCVLHLDELWAPDVDYVQVHKDNADKLILL